MVFFTYFIPVKIYDSRISILLTFFIGSPNYSFFIPLLKDLKSSSDSEIFPLFLKYSFIK